MHRRRSSTRKVAIVMAIIEVFLLVSELTVVRYTSVNIEMMGYISMAVAGVWIVVERRVKTARATA